MTHSSDYMSGKVKKGWDFEEMKDRPETLPQIRCILEKFELSKNLIKFRVCLGPQNIMTNPYILSWKFFSNACRKISVDFMNMCNETRVNQIHLILFASTETNVDTPKSGLRLSRKILVFL